MPDRCLIRPFFHMIALVVFVLAFDARVSSGQSSSLSDTRRRQNLQTCLSGRYPSLCNHSLLSGDELVRVLEAEKQENLKTCLTGRYPALCNHDLLTPAELKQVREAERQENLRVCMSGRYPSLCNRALLSPQESARVLEAERTENLRVCLSGRYPTLCNHSLLSAAEAGQVAEAERLASQNDTSASAEPRKPGRHAQVGTSGGSACEDGHWIASVSNDGEIIKLEDGSIWQVDSTDTINAALWLPVTDVIVCGDKIINVDDNESVGVTRLR